MLKRRVTQPTGVAGNVIQSWEDERYSLCGEVLLKVKKTEEGFLVSDPITLRYGVGHTIEEAKDDYMSVVLEYYESLVASEQNLAPSLKAHLQYLRTVIREKAVKAHA